MKKTKDEQPFSDEEKRMIKKWGVEKVGVVDRVYLFQKHTTYFAEKLGYVRHGEDLAKFWKNTEERKNKK